MIIKSRMTIFRWPLLYHDLSLAKEVISVHPEKPSDWDSIATKLSDIFTSPIKPVVIKGRACRERLDLLVKKYKEEDTKALKRYASRYLYLSRSFVLPIYSACRSGTEEEYTELHQLLEDIQCYLKDFSALRAAQLAEKAAQLKKATIEKNKGKK